MNQEQRSKGLNCESLSTYRGELMGIAIISIIIHHYTERITPETASFIRYQICDWYARLVGSIGVEMFLFLSGMGLYFSLRNKPDIRSFYQKRLIRVLIPYLLYAPIAWFLIDFVLRKLSLAWVVYDLSLLSFWFQGRITLWYIALILVLYLVFPLLYPLIESRHAARNTVIVIAGILFVLECFRIASPDIYKQTSIALTRIPVFIIGAYMGKKVYEKSAVTFGMVLVSLTGLILKGIKVYLDHVGNGNLPETLAEVSRYMSRYSRYLASWYSLGLIFLVVIFLMLLPDGPLQKLLRKAGTLSLELYMVHVTLRRMIIDSSHPTQSLKWYMGMVLVTILISVVLNRVCSRIQNRYSI